MADTSRSPSPYAHTEAMRCDVMKIGMEEPGLVDADGDARQKHALEISLHDRGQAVEPDGKHQHERVRRSEALNISCDLARVGVRVDIVEESLPRHDGIELFRVEVEIVDDMAARPQDLDDAAVQRADTKLVSNGWAKTTRIRKALCSGRLGGPIQKLASAFGGYEKFDPRRLDQHLPDLVLEHPIGVGDPLAQVHEFEP